MPGGTLNPPLYDLPKSPLDNSVKQNYLLRQPVPAKGDAAHRHGTLARVAMDAAASGGFFPPDENAAAYGEVVWSWRRDPGVKLLVRPMQ